MNWKSVVFISVIGCLGLSVRGAAAEATRAEAEVTGSEQPAAEQPAASGQPEADDERALAEQLDELKAERNALQEKLRKVAIRSVLLPTPPISQTVVAGPVVAALQDAPGVGSFAGAGIGGWYTRKKGIDAANDTPAPVVSAKRRGRTEHADGQASQRQRRF